MRPRGRVRPLAPGPSLPVVSRTAVPPCGDVCARADLRDMSRSPAHVDVRRFRNRPRPPRGCLRHAARRPPGPGGNGGCPVPVPRPASGTGPTHPWAAKSGQPPSASTRARRHGVADASRHTATRAACAMSRPGPHGMRHAASRADLALRFGTARGRAGRPLPVVPAPVRRDRPEQRCPGPSGGAATGCARDARTAPPDTAARAAYDCPPDTPCSFRRGCRILEMWSLSGTSRSSGRGGRRE